MPGPRSCCVTSKSMPDRETAAVLKQVPPQPWVTHKLYHRDFELETLLDSLRRACNEPRRPELTLITGSSGTGKTALAATLDPHVTELGGFFLKGKYDQLEKPDNFQPVIQALESLVSLVVERDNEAILKSLSSNIDQERDSLLLDLLPSLDNLLFDSTRNDHGTTQQRGSDAQKRLLFSIGRMLSAVASPTHPLVLLLDDIQWAGPTSIDLISFLVSDTGTAGLMLLLTCRGNEVAVDHRLAVTLRELESNDATILNIEVMNFRDVEVATMLADLTNTDVDTIWPLAQATFLKTDGNVFMVLQILRDLFEDRPLRANGLSTDETLALSETVMSWDASALLLERFRRFPRDLQHILQVASCLGCEFNEKLVSKASQVDVGEPLRQLQEVGMLETSGLGEWRFVHDQIQTYAYATIPEDEKAILHLKIGRRLWSAYALVDSIDDLLPHLVLQLRKGAHLLVDQEERTRVASLMHRAAERASSSSSFLLASSYLQLGIKMLGARHWRDEYFLSLNMFDAAAEVEYCLGNFFAAREYIDEVLEHSRNIEDSYRAWTLSIYIHGSSHELQQAIDLSLEKLADMGERVPKRNMLVRGLFGHSRLRKRLQKISNDEILALPPMQDAQHLAVARLMVLTCAYAMFGRPMLSLVLPLRLVRRTLDEGLSAMSAFGFAMFGMTMCSLMNDIEIGIRFGELSLQVLAKFDNREWLPRVYSITYPYCIAWAYPIGSLLKPTLTAHRIAMGTGDIEGAMLNAAIYGAVALMASVPLDKLYDDMKMFVELSELHKQEAMKLCLLPCLYVVSNFANPTGAPTELSGPAMSEEELWACAMAPNNEVLMAFMLRLKMMLASYFHQYEATRDLVKQLKKYDKVGAAPQDQVVSLWHPGLSYACKCPSAKCLKTARKYLKDLKQMAIHNPAGLTNKVLLLEAVITSNSDCFDEGKFLESIEYARAEQLWNEEGLAYEHLATAALKAGRTDTARMSYEKAIAAYEKWGAHAKVADVRPKLEAIPDPLIE